MKSARVVYGIVESRTVPPATIALLRGLAAYILTMSLIVAFGLLETFVMGVAIAGLGLYVILDMLNRKIDEDVELLQRWLADGRERVNWFHAELWHTLNASDEAQQPQPVYVEADKMD